MPRPTLLHYLQNASFHGYRYLSSRRRPERLLWSACCALSWAGTALLVRAALLDLQTNAVSFVAATSYLAWDTPFPAVAVCETDNAARLADVTDRVFGDPHDYNLDEVVKEVVYFRGLSFYTLQLCAAQTPHPGCFQRRLSEFERMVRAPCADILKRCRWNSDEFECCRYFTEIETEIGTCYIINSMQTNGSKYRMVSNQKNGAGKLYLEINGVANVYILGEQEVPSMTTLTTDLIQVTPHIHYYRYFALKEIENQPEVKDVSVEQRKCQFTDETKGLEVYPFYSYSSCCVQCRKDAQVRTCNCTHHLMPHAHSSTYCNITGLKCLSENYEKLSVLKPYWADRVGLVCDCLPSCTEIELSIIKEDKVGISDDFAIVELSLERLPTERFKRNVVRSKLDLVVSMGGSTGLFLGGSILSFVELFYYFIVRPISNRIHRWLQVRENRRLRGFD